MDDEPAVQTTTNRSALSLSFGSTSSSASKRTIKDGEEVVRPSDSEEDSDSSLEDVATVLGLRSKKQPSPSATKQESAENLPVTNQVPHTYGDPRIVGDRVGTLRNGSSSRRQTPANKGHQEPKLLYSLSSLVNMSNRAAKTEEKLAKLKSQIAGLEGIDENENSSARKQVNEGVLATVIEGEEKDERAKRLYQAMRRTDALEYNQVFYFFDTKKKATRPQAFPRKHLPQHSWTAVMNGKRLRAQLSTC